MAANIALYSFSSIFFIISISTLTAAAAAAAPSPADIKHDYIVWLNIEGGKAQHLSILRKVVGSEAESRIIYSYKNFNAFAARLTDKERDKLSKLDEVASVTKDQVYPLDPNPLFRQYVPPPAHQHTQKNGFNLRPILP